MYAMVLYLHSCGSSGNPPAVGGFPLAAGGFFVFTEHIIHKRKAVKE